MANLTNLNNKFLVTTGGNVGINTTSPDSKLDVTGGDITVNTTATGFMNFKYSNSQKGTIGTDGVDLKITANADLQILPASNVGIGTSSPGRKLTIGNGNGFVNNQISLLDGGGTEQATIAVETTTANDLLIASKANLRFFTGSTIGNTTTLPTNERMRIDSSGNVSLNGGLLGLGNAASTPNIGYGMFHYNGVGLGIYSSASGATQGIGFWLNNGSAYEAGRFLSNGNLGIGTTSPAKKLEVATTGINQSSTIRIQGTDGNGNGHPLDLKMNGADDSFSILIGQGGGATPSTILFNGNRNGNVGIGTSSPNFKLDIVNAAASTATYQQFRNGTTGTGSGDGTVMGIDADGDFLINNQEAKEIKLYTSDTQRLTIQSGGNVGIGAASPDFALDIEASGSGVQLQIGRTSSNVGSTWMGSDSNGFHLGVGAYGSGNSVSDPNGFTVNTSGKLGIGTASPDKRLTVGGVNATEGINLKTKSGSNVWTIWSVEQYFSQEGYMRLFYDNVSKIQFRADGNSFFNGGNVGIGTTSPGQKLEVTGNTYVTGYVQASSAIIGNKVISSVNYATFGSNSTAAGVALSRDWNPTTYPDLIINPSGNVGIGTISPRNDANFVTLQVGNTTTAASQIVLDDNDTNGPWRIISNQSLIINDDATERMRITSGGNLLFGITNEASQPTNKNFFIADFQSGASVIIGGHSGTHTAVQFRHNGSTTPGSIVITTNTTTYNTSSDYRLKEDLQDFTGLDMVSKIPVYDFKWKTDESRSYGVMAHELQKVLPDAVTGEKDAEEMQGVDYSKIVPLLVKSIQELKAEIELLKSK